MNARSHLLVLTITLFAATLFAQDQPSSARRSSRPARPATSETKSTGDYASDIAVVHESQQQALEQARQMLNNAESAEQRTALQNAIKEMERAQSALEAAKNSPDKLPTAIAAEQAAYEALLKANTREYRMSRSRNRNGQNGGAGQASQRQMDQLDMQSEENRYETERQASAPQTQKQREQVQTADRLKELSQRQQDLNERLRELQTALQAARTETERDELQRQLKRLQEEQRQLLANVDEMRQKLDQSPNAESQAQTRQRLEQTRSDMLRAAEDMERQSPSDALAAGSRAQERIQNMRDELRKQSSSQFADQLRQMRNQARDLKQQQDEIIRNLDAANGERKSLDSTAESKELVNQMQKQESTLTNLLSQMRTVTEQSETTEPLLSKQLYDTLRRADQTRTENLVEMGSQLTQRGLLPQASQIARMARTNITELASNVERAADSVLGSEADALRFADKELEDLTRQIERELSQANSNSATDSGSTNRPSARQGGGNQERAQNTPQNGQPGQEEAANAEGSENSDREPQSPGNGTRGRRGQQTAQNNSRQGARQGANENRPAQGGNPSEGSAAEYGPNQLRQWAQQLGASGQRSGPITGADYGNWVDRMRNVEQAIDQSDLRNQLATARERASVLRSDFRQEGRKPDTNVVRQQILMPMAQVRVWLREELARKENSETLVPLDRDPVPDNYADLVRKYYEKLGSAP